MRRRAKRHTHIFWNILTWECDEHGGHRVIIAGLDDTADLVADLIVRHPTEDGGRPHLFARHIQLDEARTAAEGGLDFENLPF